jgi:hypothetical protein
MSGGWVAKQRQAEQPGAEAARLKDDERAADVVRRKAPEPAGQHPPR